MKGYWLILGVGKWNVHRYTVSSTWFFFVAEHVFSGPQGCRKTVGDWPLRYFTTYPVGLGILTEI